MLPLTATPFQPIALPIREPGALIMLVIMLVSDFPVQNLQDAVD